MRRVTSWMVVLIAALAGTSTAVGAEVLISVDKTTQRMTVTVDGAERYSWLVSTGLADHATQTGAFTPSRLVKDHYSKEWDDAPMPHSIFFTGSCHEETFAVLPAARLQSLHGTVVERCDSIIRLGAGAASPWRSPREIRCVGGSNKL